VFGLKRDSDLKLAVDKPRYVLNDFTAIDDTVLLQLQEDVIRDRCNCVIIGPSGFGKSALTHCLLEQRIS
jgi:polynucleotide 5'-kinase involved in rRNA processing